MSEKDTFWSKLQRRHVVRAGVAHIVFFWLLVQVADVVLPYIGVVDNPVRWAFVAGVALFPVTLVIAWFIEHPWHKYTSSRLVIDLAIIAGIGIVATSWVMKNIPQVIHTRTSIVVMPFNFSEEDPNGQFLSRALALQINSLLMKSHSIDVVGYESANSPVLKGLDVLGIIKALNVQHVLSGVISSADASMNLSLRLHDRDGTELWASELNDSIENLPAVQEQIASDVQNRIGETGAGKAVADIAATRCPTPGNPGALERYYTARHYIESRTESEQSNHELREAVRLLKELIEEYPDFAQAYSGLSWALRYQETYDPEIQPTEERRSLGSKLAPKALEICPGLGEALVLVANEADHPNYWINEEQNFALWLEMQPDATEAVEKYSQHLAFVGRQAERVKLAEKNYRLNPLSVRAIKVLKYAYMKEGRLEEAVTLEEREFELGSTAPNFAGLMLERRLCDGDLDCFISSLGNDPFMGSMIQGEIAEKFRQIYTLPESNEQREASINLAMEMVEMTQGGTLNWFNGTSCNYEHLTPLFFRLWDRFTEVMKSNEGRWFWYFPNNWGPECHRIWEHEDFPRHLEEAGMVEYFHAKAWPDACHPDDEGEGFSCSKAIREEKRAITNS